MSKFGILGLIAVIMAIAGIVIQVAFDERGFYLVIGAVLFAIVRQTIKSGNQLKK